MKENNKIIKLPSFCAEMSCKATPASASTVYTTVLNQQNDLKRKKIEFLYNQAYQYFLDKYLMEIAEEKIVDLPPYFYETGKAICTWAKHNAQEVMLDVIKDGRVDRCYTARKRELQKAAQ